MNSKKRETDFHPGCIAIIGMAGRFPGAKDVSAFWKNLKNGVESLSFFSDKELEASGVHPECLRNPNYVKAGAILDDVESFDAGFFGVIAHDVEMMDPQHRIFLECAWEALENAGYSPETYEGSIGVYGGSRISEYLLFNQPPPDLAGLELGSPIAGFQRLIGNDKDYLATRVSFKLNLNGPSITVQTACSTSLVAVHLGCQSLLNGECDIALAGGVSVRVPQKAGYFFGEGMILSPDGHTRAFDAGAAGTLFGSGAGVVALKRLDEALADGDCIHAVIRGSAVNNDGSSAKAGYTAPSMDGQVAVIAEALSVAEVEPETLTYIEAHGTGTALGDLIELGALTRVFGAGTEKKRFCAIGSVKTNVGHLAQAAGIAGLIKTVLMLEHKLLAPSLNYETPNPEIDFDNSSFYVNHKLSEWKPGKTPRRAGVSAFGFGGTNVHMILEEAPSRDPSPAEIERPLHLLCLSAKSEDALTELANRYEHHLSEHKAAPVADVCFTANVGRSHFTHRVAVVADTPDDIRKKLVTFASGEETRGVVSGRVDPGIERPKIAFLFTGQGSQYVGMGRRLYDTQPLFRKTVDECNDLLRSYGKQPLLSVLYPKSGKASPLDETAYTQPALFVLNYALAELWRSWGIEPDVVMGHSVGEYVAACVAGVFGLEDGLKLIAERGRLMQGLPRDGEMAAVFSDEVSVAAAIAAHTEVLSIAAVNGPKSIVISGDRRAVQTVLEQLDNDGIRARMLRVSHAFHSPLMEPILDSFEQTAAQVSYSTPKLELISNVTGKPVEGAQISEAGYWRRHIREPVRFLTAMETLRDLDCEIFMELGPHPTLLGMGRQCIPEVEGVWLPSLRREQDDWQEILQSLGALYVRGVHVDWLGFDRDYPRFRVELPTYPFQRRRYWLEPVTRSLVETADLRADVQTRTHHPLLGHRLSSPLREAQFELQLSTGSHPFLEDHLVHDRIMIPAVVLVEMARAAAVEVIGPFDVTVLEEMVLQQALYMPKEGRRTIQSILAMEEDGSAGFQIYSYEENKGGNRSSWTLHAAGKVRSGYMDEVRDDVSLEAVKERCQATLEVDEFYRGKRERGMHHGPSFKGIKQIWRGSGEALARIELPDALVQEANAYPIHPVLLDACIQIGEAAFSSYDSEAHGEDNYLPMIWDRIKVCGRVNATLWSYASMKSGDAVNQEIRTVDFWLFDDRGNILVEIEGLHFKRARRETLEPGAAGEDLSDWLYQIQWQPQKLEKALRHQTSPRGKRVIFTDREEFGSALARSIEENGEQCVVVAPGEAYEATGEDSYVVDPNQPEDFQKLLKEIFRDGELPCSGVVYLWGLEEAYSEEMTVPRLQTDQARICGGALHLVQALVSLKDILDAAQTESPYLLLVTRGAHAVGKEPGPLSMIQSSLWGLSRVIMREHPEMRCAVIDLDPAGEKDEIEILLEELASSNTEDQVAVRAGVRYVPRLVRNIAKAPSTEERLSIPPLQPYRLEVARPGIVESLIFRSCRRRPPNPGEVEIRVHATGLNFRDIMNTLGRLSGTLGAECSGTVVACGDGVKEYEVGDAVVAVVPESFSTFVTVDIRFIVPKPAHINFEEAATIPIAFLTAYYGLHHLANMSSGDKVLVHSAAGGVGQAAYQLARRAGAEIFGTASRRKRPYLRSFGIQHVMDSRSLDFAREIAMRTDGQGVDIVLNTLTGASIEKSLSALGRKGRFIELGVADVWDESQIAQERPDVSFHSFRLMTVARENPDFFQAMFRELMKGFEEGTLKPLPRSVFPLEEVIGAFRHMIRADHIGKIVVSHEEQLPIISHEAPVSMRKEGTYLITGGLGGLGLRVAHWLVDQGARHITLLGRRPPSKDVRRSLDELEGEGATVTVLQADVSQPDQVAGVLQKIAETSKPLRGIVHAAGVLDDAVLEQQTWDRFAGVMAPKVTGAWNLHVMTRDMPLDFFVLFSSMASVWGGLGQGNYTAANAFLDSLAHYRRGRGLTAVSINWGAWSDVGMASALEDHIERRRASFGLGKIDPDRALQVLGKVIVEGHVQVGVTRVDWSKYARQFSDGRIPPFYSQVVIEKPESAKPDRRPPAKPEIRHRLEGSSPDEHHVILVDHFRNQVGKVLGLDPSQLELDQPLNAMGLDSLMALELRNRITAELEVDVPMVKFLEGPSVNQIATLILDYYTAGGSGRPEPITRAPRTVIRKSKDETPQRDLKQDREE